MTAFSECAPLFFHGAFMSAFQRINRVLERVYDFRGNAGRKEFFYVWAASFLFALLVAIPAVAFLYWLAYYGSNFEFADELTDAIFTPVNVTVGILWGLFAFIGSFAVTVAEIFTSMRRLNDLSLSRWLTLIYLVPFINLFFFVFLLFVPKREEGV